MTELELLLGNVTCKKSQTNGCKVIVGDFTCHKGGGPRWNEYIALNAVETTILSVMIVECMGLIAGLFLFIPSWMTCSMHIPMSISFRGTVSIHKLLLDILNCIIHKTALSGSDLLILVYFHCLEDDFCSVYSSSKEVKM